MIITVLIVGGATFLTRVIAFLAFPASKPIPPMVSYLGKALPAAVMGLLVVYSLKDTVVLTYPYGLPEMISLFVLTMVHLWKRSMMISIAMGTILYMLLIQLVF